MKLMIVVMIVFNLETVMSEFPKILWTYWSEGLYSDLTIKMYHDNHRRMVENDGW